MRHEKLGAARAAWHYRTLLLTGMAALAGLTAACGGGGDGYSAPPGNGGGNTQPLEASFASIQANVFTPICTACHLGAAAPQGLRLDAANSYGLLVGVPSAEQPALLRVEPGDPDNSYLIQKLEGTAAVGARMPLDRTPLPQADINAIRQWITEGALRNPPDDPPTDPIRVSSLAPLPDDLLTGLPASVIAIFDRELDATSVTTETFTLVRSGGDGSFADGNEVVIAAASVSVPAQNPTTAVLDLSGVPAVDDTYRVRVAGEGPAMILDLDSNALDGEFTGAFPSGDGTPGGDFLAEFVVEAVAPTLDSIQARVFTPICAECHTGPSSNTLPEGMDLSDADTSFDQLVGVASIQVPASNRVEPGDPDASYLVQKIEGTASVGERMPFEQGPLDDATIAAIREWIALGAER